MNNEEVDLFNEVTATKQHTYRCIDILHMHSAKNESLIDDNNDEKETHKARKMNMWTWNEWKTRKGKIHTR